MREAEFNVTYFYDKPLIYYRILKSVEDAIIPVFQIDLPKHYGYCSLTYFHNHSAFCYLLYLQETKGE